PISTISSESVCGATAISSFAIIRVNDPLRRLPTRTATCHGALIEPPSLPFNTPSSNSYARFVHSANESNTDRRIDRRGRHAGDRAGTRLHHRREQRQARPDDDDVVVVRT